MLIRKLIGLRLADIQYLSRRAELAKAEHRSNATVTGQIRQALDESRALRHDLRQPLNSLMLLKEILQLDACTHDEAARHLQTAIDEINGVIHRYEQHRSDASGGGKKS